MLEEARLLPILDMLSERAREFIHVHDRILDIEGALQSRDSESPDMWQVVCTISSFINFIAERNRVRYGHFAFDMDPANAVSHRRDALCTLERMEMFWHWSEDPTIGEIPDEFVEARSDLIDAFLENDQKIKEHLRSQPDIYAEGVSKDTHRDWMVRLHLLGEKERQLIADWKDLVARQRATGATSGGQEVGSPGETD